MKCSFDEVSVHRRCRRHYAIETLLFTLCRQHLHPFICSTASKQIIRSACVLRHPANSIPMNAKTSYRNVARNEKNRVREKQEKFWTAILQHERGKSEQWNCPSQANKNIDVYLFFFRWRSFSISAASTRKFIKFFFPHREWPTFFAHRIRRFNISSCLIMKTMSKHNTKKKLGGKKMEWTTFHCFVCSESIIFVWLSEPG